MFFSVCKDVEEKENTPNNIPPTKWSELIYKVLKTYKHDEKKLEFFISFLFNISDEMQFEEPYVDQEVLEKENLRKIKNWLKKELDNIRETKGYGLIPFH